MACSMSSSFAVGIHIDNLPPSTRVMTAKSRISSSIRSNEYAFLGAMKPGRLGGVS